MIVPPEGTLLGDLSALVRDRSETLPDPADDRFAEAFDWLGGARVVLLGEATHGTAEFYLARAAITRRAACSSCRASCSRRTRSVIS